MHKNTHKQVKFLGPLFFKPINSNFQAGDKNKFNIQ